MYIFYYHYLFVYGPLQYKFIYWYIYSFEMVRFPIDTISYSVQIVFLLLILFPLAYHTCTIFYISLFCSNIDCLVLFCDTFIAFIMSVSYQYNFAWRLFLPYSLRIRDRQSDRFVVTGGTAGCRKGNLRWQHDDVVGGRADDLSFSVLCIYVYCI